MAEMDGDAFAMLPIQEVSREVQMVRLHQPEMEISIGYRKGPRMDASMGAAPAACASASASASAPASCGSASASARRYCAEQDDQEEEDLR